MNSLIQLIFKYNLSGFLWISAFFVFTGCTSSVRYTRNTVSNVNIRKQPTRTVFNNSYKPDITYLPQDRLNSVIASYIGTPYRYGGESRSGLDCSGFVCLVFKEVSNIVLPHTTSKLKHIGYRISLRKSVPGDLLFFRSGRSRSIDHVGIFLGGNNGMFAHASSSKGVIYSYLSDDYHEKHLVEVRRITE